MAGNMLTKNWHKYCGIVCLILFAYSIYQTVVDDVKIVEKKVVEKVVDEQYKNLYEASQQKVTELTARIKTVERRNIVHRETVREITHPDGRIERITERTDRDTSTIDSSSESTHVTESTTTETGDTETLRHDETREESVKTKESTARFWSTITGYQVKQQEIIVGQGINLFRNLTISAIGSMKVIDSDNRFDYGVMLVMRY